MAFASRIRLTLAGLGLLAALSPATALAKPRAARPTAPPAPPNVRKFPRSTAKPPVARIIRLEPGQKRITADQLRAAPTVDAANRRGRLTESRPPTSINAKLPGTAAVRRGVAPKPPKTTPLPSRPTVPAKPKPTKAAIKKK